MTPELKIKLCQLVELLETVEAVRQEVTAMLREEATEEDQVDAIRFIAKNLDEIHKMREETQGRPG